MTTRPLVSAVMVFTLSLAARLPAQEVVDAMNAERVDEAIRLAADASAAARFLNGYVVQPRAGRGDGPLIGVLSTPFTRVVRAAVAARKRKEPFNANNVSAALIAPELRVIATSQKAWPDGAMVATVQSVVLLRWPGGTEELVQPLHTEELSTAERALNEIASTEPGVVATFPLSALTPGTVIRVTFDRTALGFSGLSMCRECIVAINLRRIR